GFALDAFENVLSLLAAAHEDDAFDGVVVIFLLVLEAEDAEARSVADFDAADILNTNGNAVVATDHYFADVVGGFHEPEAGDVVELAALRVEAAAGVGVVGLQCGNDLNDGNMKVVEASGVEEDVILHGGAAEAGIVGDAGDAAVSAFDDPVL